MLFYMEGAIICSQQQMKKYTSAWHMKLYAVCITAKCEYRDLSFLIISFTIQFCFFWRDIYLAVFNKSFFASVGKNDVVIILAESSCTLNKLLRLSLKSKFSLLLASYSLYARKIS